MALTIKTERTAKRQLTGHKVKPEQTARVYQLMPARWTKPFVSQAQYDVH